MGSGLDLVGEFTGFVGHAESWRGALSDIAGESIAVRARGELKEHWEGRVMILQRVGTRSDMVGFGLGFGFFYAAQGGRRTFRVEGDGRIEAAEGYVTNHHRGVILLCRLTFWDQFDIEYQLLLDDSPQTGMRLVTAFGSM